jgi:hypothetical protein
VFGPGWYAGRVLSGLLSVVIGMVLFEHLLRATGRWGWALLGAALYATAGLVLGGSAGQEPGHLGALRLLRDGGAGARGRRSS